MRVLAIVYCYPPLLVPAAICYMKILMGLRQGGVEVEVLHIDPETFESPSGSVVLDSELASMSPSDMLTHAVRSPETTRLIKLMKRLDSKRSVTYPWLEPKKREWIYSARRWVKKQDLNRFDVILTCSQPHANHLLGLEIQDRTGLPWVAYFSDPWTDSPYIQYASRRVRNHNLKIEDEILSRADRVLYTCDEMRELVLGNHSALHARRSGVLPHAFIPEWYDREPPEQEPRPPARLNLVQTGSFYGPRTPQPLIDAMRRVSARLGTQPGIRVDIYGALGAEHQRAIFEAGLEDVLVSHGMIPYLDTLAVMRGCDGLILVDAPLSSTAESVFLPSKLIDYLGSGTPIVAVTPEDGATARVVRATGGIVCPLERPEELDSLLLDALDNGRILVESRAEEVEQYDYMNVGVSLRDVFGQLLGSSAPQ